MRIVKPASSYAKGKVEEAEKRLLRYGLWGVVLLALALPVALLVGLLDSAAGSGVGIILAVPGLILIAIGLASWFDASNTRKGMQGEESVVSELSNLSDDFLVLNDVMLRGGKGNIDHVVVGPTGVFIVETKNYSGKYVCYGDRWFFQGKRQKYDISSVSEQARNNATILAQHLYASGFTAEVRPVIIFTHPWVELWLHHPTVPILKGGQICSFLLNQMPNFPLTLAYSNKLAQSIASSDRGTAYSSSHSQ